MLDLPDGSDEWITSEKRLLSSGELGMVCF